MAGFLSGLNEILSGTRGGINQIENFDPEQKQAAQSGLRTGLGLLQNPSQGFEPIRKSATDYYNQQIVPGLTERFASSGGASSSPSFASLLGQSGANFGSQLGGIEAQFSQNNRQQGLGLLQQGLQPYHQNYTQEAQPGILQRLGPSIGTLAQLLGQAGLSSITGGSTAGVGGLMGLLQLLNTLVNPKELQNYKQPGSGLNQIQ